MLAPLLAVYLLTALAVAAAQLLPAARSIPPLGAMLDLVPFAGAVAGGRGRAWSWRSDAIWPGSWSVRSAWRTRPPW